MNRLILALCITAIYSSISSASEYSIINAGTTFACAKFEVKENKITCSHDRATYVYEKKNITNIIYKGLIVFPYNFDEKKILLAIKAENCSEITKLLHGPLYIDKLKNANKFLGLLYDRGTCVSKDYEKALFHYALSDPSATSPISNRIGEINRELALKKEIEKQVIERQIKEEKERQEEAKRKEEKRQEEARFEEEKKEKERQEIRDYRDAFEDKIRPECQADCAINKYEIKTSCFKACMIQKGASWIIY